MSSIRSWSPMVVAAAVFACAGPPGAAPEADGLTEKDWTQRPAAVVGGTIESDYLYPWVVELNGCRGVLLDPQWVLTAAHCVTLGVFGGTVVYHRVDPYTGAAYSGSRTVDVATGIFKHPNFTAGQPGDDIALLRVSQPFTLDPSIQTVGLPSTPVVAGTAAALASFSHNQTLGAGQVAVFRAPLPSPSGKTIEIFTAATNNAALCPGDSGSGLVTLENGRAVVRGVADEATVSDCKTPTGSAVFADVFQYRDWILQTLNRTDASLAGNTRVRWSGRAARGVIGLGCTNPAGTLWGPLNVFGVQEGANCPAGETESIVCSLTSGQAVVITGFSMKTTNADGTTSTQALPFSSTFASYYGLNPAGVAREFTCSVGLSLATVVNKVGGVLAR